MSAISAISGREVMSRIDPNWIEYATECVTQYATLERAQKVYIIAIYSYTLYSCANSYYKTATNVFRVARFGYIVSNSAYQKWVHWRRKEVARAGRATDAPADKSEAIELSEIVASEPVVSLNMPIPPSDLHGVVENYFTS
jgi:hypothetical protein